MEILRSDQGGGNKNSKGLFRVFTVRKGVSYLEKTGDVM